MFVRMLTHVHLLVYTLWCWHTLRRRWSLKSRERMGSSLPPAELARQDSVLFEKMKCIFSIAPVGKFGEVAGNTHRTLATEALDAVSERPVQTVPGPARVRHRTIGTGRWLERPVCRRFATLFVHGSGEHQTLPVLSVR